MPVLAESTSLPPTAWGCIAFVRSRRNAEAKRIDSLASFDPETMHRQRQECPWGSPVKYVLNVTSQRRSTGSNEIASSIRGSRSWPGWKSRMTGRVGLSRKLSARAPAQPASPVMSFQFWQTPVGAVGSFRSGFGGRIFGSPSQESRSTPGKRAVLAGPAAGNSLVSSTM